MVTIFMDESGYTGSDLLNTEQPIFVLASLRLEEDQAEKLKQEFFSQIRAAQLSHAALSRRIGQQSYVLEFLEYLRDHPELFRLTVMHKRFVLTAKCVDLVVENWTHEVGFDLYEQGFNIALANMFYLTIPVIAGEDFFDEFLSKFQEMVRLRTFEKYTEWFFIVLREYPNEHVEKIMDWLRPAHSVLGLRLLTMIPSNSLDLAFTSALHDMALWRAEIDEEIILIHDESSNMQRQSDVWGVLTDTGLPSATLGYDRRRMVFPIGVKETRFERSEGWAGLQLVDVLAGATARGIQWFFENNDADDYGRKVSRIIQDFTVFPLLPEAKFTPEELGTVGEKIADPISYFAEVTRERGIDWDTRFRTR